MWTRISSSVKPPTHLTVNSWLPDECLTDGQEGKKWQVEPVQRRAGVENEVFRLGEFWELCFRTEQTVHIVLVFIMKQLCSTTSSSATVIFKPCSRNSSVIFDWIITICRHHLLNSSSDVYSLKIRHICRRVLLPHWQMACVLIRLGWLYCLSASASSYRVSANGGKKCCHCM